MADFIYLTAFPAVYRIFSGSCCFWYCRFLYKVGYVQHTGVFRVGKLYKNSV